MSAQIVTTTPWATSSMEAALVGDEHTAFDVGEPAPPRLHALFLHPAGCEAAGGLARRGATLPMVSRYTASLKATTV